MVRKHGKRKVLHRRSFMEIIKNKIIIQYFEEGSFTFPQKNMSVTHNLICE